MKDGAYIVKDGVVYEVTPKIKMPISKRVNMMTGEVYYPTNADRIRSMTDEELADWLNAVLASNVAPYATIRGANKRGKLLDWLKQECAE